MTDLVISVVFIVIALAVVVRTVFYCIEVLVNTKMNKKSFRLINKFFKKYEPLFDKMSDMLNNGEIDI